MTQLYELTTRSYRNLLRDRFFMTAQMVQAMGFGLIIGLVFMKLGTDQTSVQDRMGLLFMLTTFTMFSGAMGVVNTISKEKAVFLREQHAGAYSPLWYFLGKGIAETPFHIGLAVLMFTIVYLITGLSPTATVYFALCGTMVLSYLCGTSLGMLVSTCCPNFHVASAVVPVVIVPMLLSGGLLASSGRLDPYWLWLEKISIVRYAFVAMSRLEFTSLHHIDCDIEKYGSLCERMFHKGSDVIRSYGFDTRVNEYWVLYLSMAGIFVLLRVLAFLALHRIARKKL